MTLLNLRCILDLCPFAHLAGSRHVLRFVRADYCCELSRLEGVEEVEVSLRRKRAGIRLLDQAPIPNLAALNQVLASRLCLAFTTVNTEGITPSGPGVSFQQRGHPSCPVWDKHFLLS